MRVFLIAPFLILACVPLIGQQHKPETAQDKGKTGDKSGNPQPGTAITEIHGSGPSVDHAPNRKQEKTEAESKPFLTHGEWVMGILTAIYVGISFFGLRAIKEQARLAREQARIAQQAADAAKANADALINAERAYVDAELSLYNATKPTDYGLTIKNHGRTPAQIRGYWFGCNCLPKDTKVLPEHLGGLQGRANRNILLVRGDVRILDRFDIAQYFAGSWQEVRVGDKAGIFEVKVDYWDILKRDRYTRKVYSYSTIDSVLVELPQYTTYE